MGVTSYTNCTAKKYSIYVELGNKAACAACHVIFYSATKSSSFCFLCASGHFSDSYTSVGMDVSLHHFSPRAAHTGPSPPKPPLRLTQAQAHQSPLCSSPHRNPLCGSHRPKPTEAPSAAHPTETPSAAHTGPSPPKPPLRLTQAQAHRSPLCSSHRPKPTEAPSAAHTGPSPPKPPLQLTPPKPPLRLTQAQAHRSPLYGSHRPKPTKAPSTAHLTETPSAAHTGPSPPKPAQLPKKTPLVVLHTALTLLYPTVFECR